MAGIQDFSVFEDDFFGTGSIPTSLTAGSSWKATDTSAAGAPTIANVTTADSGEIALTLAATSEVENICVDFGDVLSFDIDKILSVEIRAKVTGCTSGTTIAFGLQSARNDDTNATTLNCMFKMIGATSTTNIVIETDDNVIDNNTVASGQTLATVYKRFYIDFSGGKSNIKFYVDGARCAASTTFSMANTTSSVQPFFQVSKAANTNADALTIDYVRIECKR